MDVKAIYQTARCVTLEITDGSVFESDTEKEIRINGKYYGKTRRVIYTVYGLKPDREYVIEAGIDRKSVV